MKSSVKYLVACGITVIAAGLGAGASAAEPSDPSRGALDNALFEYCFGTSKKPGNWEKDPATCKNISTRR